MVAKGCARHVWTFTGSDDDDARMTTVEECESACERGDMEASRDMACEKRRACSGVSGSVCCTVIFHSFILFLKSVFCNCLLKPAHKHTDGSGMFDRCPSGVSGKLDWLRLSYSGVSTLR